MVNTSLSCHHGDKGLYSSVHDRNLSIILGVDKHTPFSIINSKLFIILKPPEPPNRIRMGLVGSDL